MTKQKIIGISGGNINNTSYGYDEESAKCIQLKELLTLYFSRLEGIFMSDCSMGLNMISSEAAVYAGKELICVAPYEEQAEKWADFYRERYFSLHEKSKNALILSKRYSDDCEDNAKNYIAESCDVMVAVKSKDEELDSCAAKALELGKEVIVIDSDDLTIETVKHSGVMMQ